MRTTVESPDLSAALRSLLFTIDRIAMKTTVRPTRFVFGILAITLVWCAQPGCMLLSNVMHAVGANQVPPECDELEGSKVAILVVTDKSQYSDDITARLLTRKLAGLLTNEVKGIELIREDVVQDWRDTHGWDNSEYLDLGKGVKAEKLLVVELSDLKLRDGATLYRGRADVNLMVFDIGEERALFNKEIDEFMYPVNAGQYTSETTEPKFRKLFLEMMSRRIARTFHPYDFADTIALDGAIASQ